MKLALGLHPSAEHVFVVADQLNQTIRELFRTQSRDSASKATLTFIDAPTGTP